MNRSVLSPDRNVPATGRSDSFRREKIPTRDPEHPLADLRSPQGHAWCVGGDVDLVSPYVGGSAACVADLLAPPDLEAYTVTETTMVN